MKKIDNSIIKKTISITLCIILLSTITATAVKINKNDAFRYKSLLNSGSKAFILTIDDYYLSSSFSVIDVENPDSVELDIASTHGDDEVRYYDGKLYVLNRFGHDLIEVFDTNNHYEKISDFSTGEGSNPQDIAFISEDKAYVSCYDTTHLLIVNPSTGEHIGSIDLSDYADDDGIPEMHKMVEFKFFGKSRVYLTIQRLDRDNWYEPTNKSYILEINGDADEVIRAIELSQVNPSTAPILDGCHILVGETGSWFDFEDGGIDKIGLFTNKAEGFIVSEADLGGNLLDFDIYSKYSGLKGLILSFLENHFRISLLKRNIYAIVSDPNYNTSLVTYNIKENTAEELMSTSGYHLVDLAINNNEKCLYICDRTGEVGGIHIFDTDSDQKLIDNAIDVGMYPPVHITFFEN